MNLSEIENQATKLARRASVGQCAELINGKKIACKVKNNGLRIAVTWYVDGQRTAKNKVQSIVDGVEVPRKNDVPRVRFLELLEQINRALADYDARALKSAVDSIQPRRDAVAAVRARRHEFVGAYASNDYAVALINAAGGKTWKALLEFGDAELIRRIEKIEAAKVESRNANIVLKISRLEISAVEAGDAIYSNDGFTGVWRLETDNGPHIVKIQVVGAGGYNVQAWHYRCLCDVYRARN